jgi:serine/threonine protein kinase
VQEVQGKGYLSKAADMYSFGVLLWEMFHGMPPYAADNGHLVNNASFPRFDLRHREDAPFSYVVVALACLSTDHENRCVLSLLDAQISCGLCMGAVGLAVPGALWCGSGQTYPSGFGAALILDSPDASAELCPRPLWTS